MALGTQVALALSIAVISAAGVGVLLWLALGRPPLRQAGSWTTSSSFEFAKIVLALVGGVGAVVALVVAYRKQHLGEVAERREDIKLFAERFTKASDQLGSDKAPVRLAGMYALEDLGQGTPSRRQTIVNVLCAYLRMPYLPPVARSSASSGPVETAASTAPDGAGTEPHQDVDQEETEHRLQEHQVRLTAQRILAAHLHPQAEGERPSATFWENIDLDLTGATLVDLDLGQCHIRTAQFKDSTFSGDARFDAATFSGHARFDAATFNADARFDAATFNMGTWFSEAKFNRDARFSNAAFNRDAGFDEARFNGDTGFNAVTFNGDVVFNAVTFNADARFSNAAFNRDAGFDEATFNGDVGFNVATFNGAAVFGKATFNEDTRFSNAAFNGDAWFGEAKFNKHVGFDWARFSGEAGFIGVTFNGDVGFGEAKFNGDAGFNAATFNGDTGFGAATFSMGAWFIEATFNGVAQFIEATFNGDAMFSRAKFSEPKVGMRPHFEGARVRLDATLIFERTWPDGVVAVDPASEDEARLPDREGRWGYLQATIGDDLPRAEPGA